MIFVRGLIDRSDSRKLSAPVLATLAEVCRVGLGSDRSIMLLNLCWLIC